ncbi:MAG: hypothetical protein WDA28_12795 [Castellaniella sp.]
MKRELSCHCCRPAVPGELRQLEDLISDRAEQRKLIACKNAPDEIISDHLIPNTDHVIPNRRMVYEIDTNNRVRDGADRSAEIASILIRASAHSGAPLDRLLALSIVEMEALAMARQIEKRNIALGNKESCLRWFGLVGPYYMDNPEFCEIAKVVNQVAKCPFCPDNGIPELSVSFDELISMRQKMMPNNISHFLSMIPNSGNHFLSMICARGNQFTDKKWHELELCRY